MTHHYASSLTRDGGQGTGGATQITPSRGCKALHTFQMHAMLTHANTMPRVPPAHPKIYVSVSARFGASAEAAAAAAAAERWTFALVRIPYYDSSL